MNIYIQNKTAKEAGVLKELKSSLNPKINELFCWDVVLIKKYGKLLNNMEFLGIRNSLTGYLIFAPFSKDLDENIFDLIEEYIRKGIDWLNLDKEIVDNYFKEAGKFEFGIMSDRQKATLIKNRFINENIQYFEKNQDKFRTQEEASKFVSEKFNSRKHYLKRLIDHTELMASYLTDLYNHQLRGVKAYELLVTLDVENYQATRRIIVPADITFLDLNQILYEIYDWSGYHLSSFDLYERNPGDIYIAKGDLVLDITTDDYKDETMYMEDYQLEEMLGDFETIYWTYDFGDYWLHKIELMEIYDDYQGELPYLLEAHYNAPPEDVGGTSGFQEFLEAISDPNNEDYELYKTWRPNWKPKLNKSKRTPHKIKYKHNNFN